MESKNKTAPLFDLPEDEIPPTDELPSQEASFAQRIIASLIDFILIALLICFPFLFLKQGTNFYSFAFSLLLYSFDMILAYHFLFYFFLGRTLGDIFSGIRLFTDKFTLTEAFLYSLVKTLFTIIPMNLVLPFLTEGKLTGEQFIFDRIYQIY